MPDLITITPDDIRKLRHMLGASEQHKKRDYGFRNYYATSGGEAMEAMERLVAAGLAKKGQTSETGKMHYYHATVKGCEFIGFTKAQIKRAFDE
ncbi:MAG: hypothetical protein AB1807_11820 [Pseudomonadota bacterium]